MQKIVEEDLCLFAAVLMMPLDQTVMYTTHRPRPLGAEILAGPVIDVSVQPCNSQDCPVGPVVHDMEELAAARLSKFHVVAALRGSLMVVHKDQGSGIALVEDDVDPAPSAAQVLRWDVASSHPRVVTTSVLVQSRLLVGNPQSPKEHWCPWQQVRAWSTPWPKP